MLVGVQEGVETELALGTAREGEEVVEEEEVAVVEQGQAVGTRRGLHSETRGPVAGWGTFPSAHASAHWGKRDGSWEQDQAGVEEEMLHRWCAEQEEEMGAEVQRQVGGLGWEGPASARPWLTQGWAWMAEEVAAGEAGH